EYYSDILTLAAARGDMESIDNILILRPRTRIDDMASIRAAENGYRRTTHKLFQLGLTNYSDCAEIAAKNGHMNVVQLALNILCMKERGYQIKRLNRLM